MAGRLAARLLQASPQPPASGALLPLLLQAAAASARRWLATGDSYRTSRVFTAADAAAFARLTGDSNPIHGSGHPSPILPGLLMASLFPAIIGSNFPGALYLTQTLKFRRAAPPGEAVHAEVVVTARSGSRVTFATTVRDAQGRVLVDGSALALMRGGGPTATAGGGGGCSEGGG